MNDPKWVTLARAEIGTHEIKGKQENARIIRYRTDARCTWVKGSEEDVPWCAIFVNAMLERAGIPGTRSPAAKSFTKSKDFLRLPRAAEGAICVIDRVPASPFLGHVGILVGAYPDQVELLGGNQSNAVSVARFARSRVCGFYWPASLTLPVLGDFHGDGAVVEGGKVT